MIKFFFEYGGVIAQLPVNPEELVIQSPGNNKSEELITLGEINIIRKKKLNVIKLKGFLPTNGDAPYVTTKGAFKDPDFYVEMFQTIRDSGKPFRFIVSDVTVNMLATIEEFEYGVRAGDDDCFFEMEIKAYQPYGAKEVKITPATPTAPAKAATSAPQRPKTGFAIGDTVNVNGKYWADSYGGGKSGTFSNFTGKISHIVADTKRAYRYHITTTTGGYRGWVSESQLAHK